MTTKKISLKSMRPAYYLLLVAFFSILTHTSAQTITATETDGSTKRLRNVTTPINFTNGNFSDSNLRINENTMYQTVDGFGYALTQGSAKAILALRDDIENQLLNELFNPNSGNAIGVVRISIGASDLSEATYTYSNSRDTSLRNFAIDSRDTRDVIPVLQKIRQINPNIKILATPWTAPIWMKDGAGSLSQDEKNIFLANKYRSGRLQPRYYGVYANYFLKYLQAMNNFGIPIWAITPQNEPENPFNEPSMKMTQEEQYTFVNSHLGPTLNSNGFRNVKIFGFDHNCDNTAFPSRVAQSSHVDGSAFHLYAGNISAMSTVRNTTNKDVYFTEQFTATNGSFDGDLGFHMENVVIGSLKNWSKTVLEWNLANDASFGPRTPGGCSDCLGAITVNNSTSFTRNVSYYIIAQASRFIKPGARRIQTTGVFAESVAFKNPDGSIVLLAYNKFGGNYNMRVNVGNKRFSYNIPPRTAITFRWTNGKSAPSDATAVNQFPVEQAASNLEELKVVNVFPNPVNSEFTISLDGFAKAKIVITDLLGKTIYKTTTVDKELTLTKGDLFTTGTYLITVTDDDASSYTSKLIIE